MLAGTGMLGGARRAAKFEGCRAGWESCEMGSVGKVRSGLMVGKAGCEWVSILEPKAGDASREVR